MFKRNDRTIKAINHCNGSSVCIHDKHIKIYNQTIITSITALLNGRWATRMMFYHSSTKGFFSRTLYICAHKEHYSHVMKCRLLKNINNLFTNHNQISPFLNNVPKQKCILYRFLYLLRGIRNCNRLNKRMP